MFLVALFWRVRLFRPEQDDPIKGDRFGLRLRWCPRTLWWEKTRLRRKSVLAAVIGRIARDPIIRMGIFCNRSGAGDRNLEICNPWDGQPVGLTFISGAKCSRQIGLAGMGRRQVRAELRRHHDPNPVFPLTICRYGIARILVKLRVGLKPGLTRDHSRVQKS